LFILKRCPKVGDAGADGSLDGAAAGFGEEATVCCCPFLKNQPWPADADEAPLVETLGVRGDPAGGDLAFRTGVGGAGDLEDRRGKEQTLLNAPGDILERDGASTERARGECEARGECPPGCVDRLTGGGLAGGLTTVGEGDLVTPSPDLSLVSDILGPAGADTNRKGVSNGVPDDDRDGVSGLDDWKDAVVDGTGVPGDLKEPTLGLKGAAFGWKEPALCPFTGKTLATALAPS